MAAVSLWRTTFTAAGTKHRMLYLCYIVKFIMGPWIHFGKRVCGIVYDTFTHNYLPFFIEYLDSFQLFLVLANLERIKRSYDKSYKCFTRIFLSYFFQYFSVQYLFKILDNLCDSSSFNFFCISFLHVPYSKTSE